MWIYLSCLEVSGVQLSHTELLYSSGSCTNEKVIDFFSLNLRFLSICSSLSLQKSVR